MFVPLFAIVRGNCCWWKYTDLIEVRHDHGAMENMLTRFAKEVSNLTKSFIPHTNVLVDQISFTMRPVWFTSIVDGQYDYRTWSLQFVFSHLDTLSMPLPNLKLEHRPWYHWCLEELVHVQVFSMDEVVVLLAMFGGTRLGLRQCGEVAVSLLSKSGESLGAHVLVCKANATLSFLVGFHQKSSVIHRRCTGVYWEVYCSSWYHKQSDQMRIPPPFSKYHFDPSHCVQKYH